MLKIISLNVNGLRSSQGRSIPKRRKLFTWLKRKEADIYMLQETHSLEEDSNRWLNEWGGEGFFAHGEARCRGVAVLLKPGSGIQIKLIKADPNGRYLIAEAETKGASVTLVNIYGPNTDSPSIYEDIYAQLTDHEVGDVVMGGDFNFGLDINIDRSSLARTVHNNDRCKKVVEDMMDEFHLVDAWRKQNPYKKEFTYCRESTGSGSRIDFFLMSEALFYGQGETRAEIEDGFLSDHKMITLKVQICKIETGRSYWKCNRDLLQDEQFRTMITEKVPIIIAENDSDDISRALLLETTLCVLRGEIIRYAATKKRQRKQEFDTLDREINEMTRNSDSLSIFEKELLESKKVQMSGLVEKMTERNMWNAKVRWRMHAERGSKYFHRLPYRSVSNNVFKAMVLSQNGGNEGEVTDDAKEMLRECQSYFANLYGAQAEPDVSLSEEFFQGTRTITPNQEEACERPFDDRELEQALFSMKNGTSPGPSGFTAEFFKIFWPVFKELITQAVDEMLEIGIPNSMKSSITILIPKRGKDRRKVENLRPISLLNVIYKLITKAIALRVRKVIKDIIHQDQTGFIQGRYIGENVRLVLDTIQSCSEDKVSALLLACDMQKAYDSVSWTYLKMAVQRYGFGPNFRKWINVLYDDTGHNTNPTARVQINGLLSEPYVIKRGLRQGCPLSCYLFLMCIEPLISRIRESNDIVGLNLHNTTVKVSAYADDLTVILNGSNTSLQNCVQTFEDFDRLSGLKLNKGKSKCMWIGYRSREKEFICEEIGLSWTRGPIEVLGLLIGCESQQELIQRNYCNKIDKLQASLNPWLKRGLTPYGRVHLIKSVALSQLTYCWSVLPQPGPDLIKRIEEIMFQFIWNKKRAKVKKDVMKGEYKEGGLKVPDIISVIKSLKIGWVKRYLDLENRSQWKKIMKPILNINDETNIFDCNATTKQILSRVKNTFWVETVEAWRDVANKETATSSEMLNEVIWLNKHMHLEQNPGIRCKRFVEKGILRVKDLYDFNRNRLFSANELAVKLRFHPMSCSAVLQAIPSSWRALLNRNDSIRPVENQCKEDLRKSKRAVRWAYLKIIRKAKVQPTACSKWADELGLPPTFNWGIIFNRPYVITDDHKLRWLQFQCLHRFLPTNKRLFMYGLKETDKCRECRMYQETIAHLFWHCGNVQRFWRQVESKFRIRERLSFQQVICGVGNQLAQSDSLDIIILLAKQFIWNCRAREMQVTFQAFMDHVKQFSRLEKHVAQIQDKVEKYENRWRELNEAVSG